ncbi:hypothetical protein IMSAGC012_01457 [Lachnospiraceae bacterium]|nr:hypothetical protein IMSAGC012_01457 [Lachnospiraceae bacterium]
MTCNRRIFIRTAVFLKGQKQSVCMARTCRHSSQNYLSGIVRSRVYLPGIIDGGDFSVCRYTACGRYRSRKGKHIRITACFAFFFGKPSGRICIIHSCPAGSDKHTEVSFTQFHNFSALGPCRRRISFFCRNCRHICMMPAMRLIRRTFPEHCCRLGIPFLHGSRNYNSFSAGI